MPQYPELGALGWLDYLVIVAAVTIVVVAVSLIRKFRALSWVLAFSVIALATVYATLFLFGWLW